MHKKPARVALVGLSMLLYCSCLKRENKHPYDPLFTPDWTEVPDTGTFTDTFTETHTPTHTDVFTDTPTWTFTDTETPAETYTFTDTYTITDTPTETHTPTDTPTPPPQPWIDRGEVTGDICEGLGGCHGGAPTCTGGNLNEAVGGSAVYPRFMSSLGATVAMTAMDTGCWAPGSYSWSCNCVGTVSPSGATCDISNFTGTAYGGSNGCLRLSGSMKGYTWGGWSWQRSNICQSWAPVDITAYDGISFYGMTQGGGGSTRVAIGEPLFDGGGFYSGDIRCDNPATLLVVETCTHGSDITLTAGWTLHEVPFAGMDSGWPSSYPIAMADCGAGPGSCVSGDPIFVPGVEIGPAVIGAYDSLIDELKFY